MGTDNINFIGNTPIISAASAGDWEEVAKLLASGADVRSCNWFGQNALYFALIDGEFDLAFALFDAGARLDELDSVDKKRSALGAAAEMRRTGRDIFAHLNKNIVALCRNGAYIDAEKHLDGATANECSEALNELVRHGKYRPEVNLALAKKLFSRGGKVDLKLFEKYATCKLKWFRNPESYVAKFKKLIEKYQNNPAAAMEEINFAINISGKHCELEIRQDGSLWLFIPGKFDPPLPDGAQDVGNGLFLVADDSRQIQDLMERAKNFLENEL